MIRNNVDTDQGKCVDSEQQIMWLWLCQKLVFEIELELFDKIPSKNEIN